MPEEIEGFIPVIVQIGDHLADLRYVRVLPRIGEAVVHVDGAGTRRDEQAYRVVDIWHGAWHPERAPDVSRYPTIVLDDPREPGTYGREAGRRLNLDDHDIDLLATRIAERFEQE